MMYRTGYTSPLGELTLYSDGYAITAITMPQWRYQPPEHGTFSDTLPVFLHAKQCLYNYFTSRVWQSFPPISAVGTSFQQQVWQLVQTIPFGSTVTYGELARQLSEMTGHHTSARAVGHAVGRNPVAILIPCHRVLGADRRLTGFGGGLDAKQFLLDLESIPYRL